MYTFPLEEDMTLDKEGHYRTNALTIRGSLVKDPDYLFVLGFRLDEEVVKGDFYGDYCPLIGSSNVDETIEWIAYREHQLTSDIVEEWCTRNKAFVTISNTKSKQSCVFHYKDTIDRQQSMLSELTGKKRNG